MRIDVVTIFPGMFEGPFSESIIKRARDRGIVTIDIHNLRDYTEDKHKSVDDYPFGGGAGMVMKPEPLFNAVRSIIAGGSRREGDDSESSGGNMSCRKSGPRVILMTPQGRLYNQDMAKELSREESLIFICGHYEGIDERVRQSLITDEISIGDYVLTGGELPAMVVIDALCRMIPGVLEEESRENDSFYNGLLEHPHYTRPRVFEGMEVPGVLLNGHHEEIRRWRRKESLQRTLSRRRDLLDKVELTEEDRKLLAELTDEEP